MFIGSILILIAIAEVCLGVWFIRTYKNNLTTFWFGLFSIASAVYVGSNGLGYAGVLISGQMAEHLAWAGGMMSAMFFLPFSFSFPLPQKRQEFLLTLAVWPMIIFVPGLLWTNLFVIQNPIVLFGQGYSTAAGPLFWLMILFFVVYWSWAVINLVSTLRRTDGVHRQQLFLILFGILVSLLVSVVFDIYLPLMQVTKFGYVGSLFTSVWLGFTSYIILRK